MKTKELKKIVEDNGYSFEKAIDHIFIKQGNELVMQLNMEKIIRLQPYYSLWSKQIKNVMKALIEYSETPIEEREEEKKYRLEIFDNEYGKISLHEVIQTKWILSGLTTYHFTQSEIDNFPPEIKGAIECGFLKKVEVEE